MGRALLLSVLLAVGTISNMCVAESYPSHSVRIVIPGAAGGVLDIGVRKIADKLSKSLGQPVIVDNKPGANGFIAAEAAAKSKPDGYTIFVGASSQLCANPSLFKKLPYDPIRDFAPVTLATGGQPVLLVSPNLPVKTLKEFVAYARANPGKVTYGSPAVGTPNHLAMELLSQLTGISMIHIPYKNQPQILTDLSGEQIQASVEFISLAGPFIQSGKVRAITVVGSRRKVAFPDLPTAAESGIPGFDISGWYGYLVPAGTPADIIARLNKELNVAFRSKEFTEFVETIGAYLMAGTPDEFAQVIRSEQQHWAQIIKQANVHLD